MLRSSADWASFARATRWQWWLVGVLIVAGALVYMQSQPARAEGEGTFSLELSAAAAPDLATEFLGDGSGYTVQEGQALVVRVKRTPDATLRSDVTVMVQLCCGIIGTDYGATATSPFVPPTPPAPSPPALPIIQVVTFPAGTNLTSRDTAPFLTFNRNQIADRTFQVTLLSVSGGSIGSASTAPLILRGTFAPRVTNVAPRSGWTGTVVQLTGGNFTSATTTTTNVNFYPVIPPGGPAVAAAFTPPTSATALSITVPVLAPGVEYDIRVTVTGGAESTAVLADRFVAANGAASATVTSVSPSSGPYLGGTTVTILGTNLACPTLTFGGTAAASCTATGTSMLRAVTPPRPPLPPGVVDVVVADSVQTADTKFTYTGGPVITAITPPFGPVSGGNQVIITGSGFRQLTSGVQCPAGVTFGGNTTPSCTVNSDTQITAVAPAPTGPGTVQVVVSHPLSGPSAFTTDASYTYVSGPVVMGLAPNGGPPQGGTVVTVTGAGFAQGATVSFGSAPSPLVIFDSASQLRATAPPGAGMVDVIVTVGGTASPIAPADRFSYSNPTVTSISPNAGPHAGGTTVTITGANFTPDASIKFGAAAAASVTFVSTVQIMAVTPVVANDVGQVDVQVTTPTGQSLLWSASKFTFTDGPIVASVNPNAGPTGGSTIVIITGTGFAADARVAFGSTQATTFNINSPTQITAISPPVAGAGAVDVQVTTSAGASPATAVDQFTYGASPPLVTAVSPNTGPTVGGTTVTITGTGFLAATCPSGVMFGSLPAASCTVDSDTSITAVSPPNVSGKTWVVVNTPGGSSEVSLNFTYTSGAGAGTSAPAPNPPGATSYALSFRWSLITWAGKNGVAVVDALKGTPGTAFNDVSGKVSAIFGWDSQAVVWHAYFTGAEGTPGASDLATMTVGNVYWVALTSPGSVTWTVEQQ